MLKTMLKRTALALVVCALALTWSQSGRAAAFCVIERGLDPLDILSTGVKHNVWIVLDTSGSMGDDLTGNDNGDPLCTGADDDTCWDPTSIRLDVAKSVLTNLIQDVLVDASGNALVNWGYVNFAVNSRDPDSACELPGIVGQDPQNECVGLDFADLVSPPACGGDDNRATVLENLDAVTDDGWTPNGISVDQISDRIVASGGVSGLLTNQGNFIILLTDGEDTCECDSNIWEDDLAGGVNSSTAYLRSQNGTSAEDTSNSVSDGGESRAYNAGLKGRRAYQRLNPTAADHAGATKGDIFVVGLGFDDTPTLTNGERYTNHMAWEASGAAGVRPDPHGAFFANNEADLIQALKDILSGIGVPNTETTLGASIVGSVKELVPPNSLHGGTDPSVTAAELIASGNADVEARKLRAQYRNNVLFTTSVETPGFAGHLRAYNIYETQSDGSRQADFSLVWDAGEALNTRDLNTNPRDIYFNDSFTPGSAPQSPVPFSVSSGSLTANQLGVDIDFLIGLDPTGTGFDTAEHAATFVEKIIRGWPFEFHPTYGFYSIAAGAGRTAADLNFSAVTGGHWKLFDATNSAPVVVLNPPRSPDVDPPQPALAYGSFHETYINRLTVAYLGTNGGMMHAFRADSGYELYAYIPHDLLPRLKDLVRLLVSGFNGVANHEFFVASSGSVQDAYLQSAPSGSDEFRTVLAFGRGKGGKFLTALDITEVGDWEGNSVCRMRFEPTTVRRSRLLHQQDCPGLPFGGFVSESVRSGFNPVDPTKTEVKNGCTAP